jgi:hypothetical protein
LLRLIIIYIHREKEREKSTRGRFQLSRKFSTKAWREA